MVMKLPPSTAGQPPARRPAASRPAARPGPRHGLINLLLVAALILLPSVAPAAALGWPGGGTAKASQPPAGRRAALQEQPPPLAVQQLAAALEQRQPRVEIIAPADGAVLPDGPWDLDLKVSDWPLVDAGPLGLGPHLLVLIDGQPPLATTATHLTLPALTPGSHRLTVVAARPWGEAVKQPQALDQHRLHRVAADPQALPALGSPQLLAVAPQALSAHEPILVDWLMADAPLQHLRTDDTSWRLRLTLNGDSVLIDRQQALWLSGWHRGSNALLLELLNGRGEPLNPPFTSQVRELTLAADAPEPRWRQGPLEPLELQQLLGDAPPPGGPPIEQGSSSEPVTATASPEPVEGPAAPPAQPEEDLPLPQAAEPGSSIPETDTEVAEPEPAPAEPVQAADPAATPVAEEPRVLDATSDR